jgi:hypothetical protein
MAKSFEKKLKNTSIGWQRHHLLKPQRRFLYLTMDRRNAEVASGKSSLTFDIIFTDTLVERVKRKKRMRRRNSGSYRTEWHSVRLRRRLARSIRPRVWE